ncbi:MAG: ATP-binding protein [Saprospiraceae bacterium]|nr:ATP-binding protein [Saprospiraceae bacterium]
MKLIGRLEESALLKSLLHKNESEFVAVYGRRRIGKTYLVRQVYEGRIVFECSGLHQKDKEQQLENFWLTLAEYNQEEKPMLPPKSWLQAFAQLRGYLTKLPLGDKKVVFLDEISWFDTPRAGFLAALDNFWNQFCTKRDDIILVICGSAASWIIQKVVNDRGGLHNRITQHIQLMPFKLGEMKSFLEARNVHLSLKDITQLYMCVGGIPFYIKDVEAGKSVAQILDSLFFGNGAKLKNEFPNLYAALFKNNQGHETVVQALAQKNKGLTRNEIIRATGISSGGGLTLILEELLQCGFIRRIYPFSKVSEDGLYRLVDEFSLFYFRFLHNQKGTNSWLQIAVTPAFKNWSGYAFESLCFKHVYQIKKALGIHGVISNEYSWYQKGNSVSPGAQIDFILDRSDNCINLFELKFHDAEFEVTKEYASQLREKIEIFKHHTRTKKNVFITLLTVFGMKRNEHALSMITQDLILDVLFD